MFENHIVGGAGELEDPKAGGGERNENYKIGQEPSAPRSAPGADMPARVVILGGGVAGLSAAHELVKFTDFEVHVFDQGETFGGKAVSREVPLFPRLKGGKRRYPAEHGFRLFPHFYKHVTETMKEIPFTPRTVDRGRAEAYLIEREPGQAVPEPRPGRRLANPEDSVWGNLIGSTEAAYAHEGVLHVVQRPFPYTGVDFVRMVRDTIGDDTLATETDIAAYSWYLLKFMTSCKERREEQYERMSWLEFLAVDRGIYSPGFEKLMRALPRTLQAMRPDIGSARTVGDITLQLFFDFSGDGGNHMESVLAGPTQETWLDPWVEYLKEHGVTFWPNSKLNKLCFDGLNVTGAEIQIDGKGKSIHPRDLTPEDFGWTTTGAAPNTYLVTGKKGIDANPPNRQYYICALPLEVVQRLFANAAKELSEPRRKVAPVPAGARATAGDAGKSDPEADHRRMLQFDCSLRQMLKIERAVLPMVGIQFYLRKDVPLCNGHVFYPDSPFALTSISQAQFWEKLLPGRLSDYFGDVKGNGIDRFGAPLKPPEVKGILSVIISDWDAPCDPRPEFGLRDPSDGLKGVPAREMSEAQIKREVWAQLKDALNVPGKQPLLDDFDLWQALSDEEVKRLSEAIRAPATSETYVDRLDTFLKNAAVLDASAVAKSEPLPATALRAPGQPWVGGDRAVRVFKPGTKSDPAEGFTPLFVHPKGSYPFRPDAQLRIPNLMLAADYVRTYTDLASMEGANEAAKRAVLAILRREELSPEGFPRLHPLTEGRLFEVAQALDRLLFNAGRQPHVMDMPQLLGLLGGSVAQNVVQIGFDLLGIRRKPPAEMARRAAGFPLGGLPPTTVAPVMAAANTFAQLTGGALEKVRAYFR